MELTLLFAGLEVLLFVVTLRKIRYNETLIREIRKCSLDLASAMHCASQGRYGEARTAVLRWHARMKAVREGKRAEAYRPPPWDGPRGEGRHRQH